MLLAAVTTEWGPPRPTLPAADADWTPPPPAVQWPA